MFELALLLLAPSIWGLGMVTIMLLMLITLLVIKAVHTCRNQRTVIDARHARRGSITVSVNRVRRHFQASRAKLARTFKLYYAEVSWLCRTLVHEARTIPAVIVRWWLHDDSPLSNPKQSRLFQALYTRSTSGQPVTFDHDYGIEGAQEPIAVSFWRSKVPA